jgi:hypothetical protein
MVIPLADLGPLVSGDPGASRPELQVEVAASSVPLVLLPVRLETRFFRLPDRTSELRIRVYPDKVHLDAHDPELSAEEVDWGKRYWILKWHAGTDDAAMRRAWQMLADRFEPYRAAWIARVLTPTNPGKRPTTSSSEDTPLPVAPRFPSLGDPSTTIRTPVARLLPDRWTATAYQDGGVVGVATGRDIDAELAVGPDLSDDVAPDAIDDEAPAVDKGMAWMVDFDSAEEVGMALRMSLGAPAANIDIDVLLVSGVRGSVDADQGSDDVAGLLDAHHYTDGLGFVPAGTPSNNTSVERAGYRSADARQEASYADEWLTHELDVDDPTNAALTAVALGLAPERADATLGRLPHAHDRDSAVATSMMTALWPSTWGYFLPQMIGFSGSELTPDAVDWVRDHALGHLRPRGPLPALRCGRQPYGLLPVTSVHRWQTALDHVDAARDNRLAGLVDGLRDEVWRPAVQHVARVGRTDDPSSDLVDLLRTDAQSTRLVVRRLMGRIYLRHLRAFLGERLDAIGFWTRMSRMTAALPARLGFDLVTPLSQTAYDNDDSTVTAPLVQADAADGTKATALAPNYIADLLAAAELDPIAMPVPQETMPLLRALLRHGLLREHAHAGARLVASEDVPLAQLLRDAEFVDLVPGLPPTRTWSRLRDLDVPGISPTRTVREHLDGLTDFTDDAVRRLGEYREALSELSATPVSMLKDHLVATLDACSHRLDAWITSLATRRLAQLREQNPVGLVVGGYGWVEHLRPDPPRPAVKPPAQETGPLSTPAADPGFIHAPSLNQASTAALLRNAHLAHGGEDDGPYAIELTSERVRHAQKLFDGVRQGQPLAALLGYDFERRLHDLSLDLFIDDFRRMAPGVALLDAEGTPPRVVVDGLALRSQWKGDETGVLSALPGFSALTASRQRQVRAALDSLDVAIDGAADAVTAESVYQLVRGNLSRGGSSLDKIASGESPPPQLEFMRTPRSGTGLTHRVALLLSARENSTPAGSGWAGPGKSPRARAEPVLNAWAARLLGPATGVVARVRELREDGSAVELPDVPFTALELSPLDLVFARSGGDAEPDELAQRILDAAFHRGASSPAPRARLVVDLARRPGAPPFQRSVTDVRELAAAIKRLIAAARSADGVDLRPPHLDPDRGLDLGEFGSRAAAAEARLGAVHNALAALVQPAGGPSVARLREALLDAAGFGVVGAVPDAPVGDSDEAQLAALVTQSAAVVQELARRVAEGEQLRAQDTAAGEAAQRDRLHQRMQAVFGPGFVALPHFSCANAADLGASVADAVSLRGEDTLAAYTWLQRMGRVRPGLAKLELPLREAEVLGTGETLRLSIAQVPHAAGQRWIGLEAAPGVAIPDGCAGLVLQTPSSLDFAKPMAGLLVDEWVEIVPSRTETTGIAFQYDPPDASAPQAILLAVPPVPDEPWRIDSLNQVLLETLELARLRTVGPEQLSEIAHYLPAIYLAFNVEADAVSTDLNPLAP